MTVSSKTDLRFPESGQQGHEARIIHEERVNQAITMDETSLRAAAQKHAKSSPIEKEVIIKQVARDPYIAEYAKFKAKGICQLCGKPAPFNDSKGRPYLESHHIVWIANGGEDTIENTVALCPNCHKKMHIVADETDVETLLSKIRNEFALTALGGFLGWFLGGFDGFLYALVALMVADYITGVMCAIVDKTL